MSLGIQKLFGIGATQGTTGVIKPQPPKAGTNFVKDSFNFGVANPNQPNQIIAENNPLGIPSKGTKLYCLG